MNEFYRRVSQCIFDAVGTTPSVHLQQNVGNPTAAQWVKLTSAFLGRSETDQPARKMRNAASARGEIGSQSTSTGSSSHNIGPGSASMEGLKFARPTFTDQWVETPLDGSTERLARRVYLTL